MRKKLFDGALVWLRSVFRFEDSLYLTLNPSEGAEIFLQTRVCESLERRIKAWRAKFFNRKILAACGEMGRRRKIHNRDCEFECRAFMTRSCSRRATARGLPLGNDVVKI